MSELSVFAAHARTMVTADHRPECWGTELRHWGPLKVRPNPECPGCVTDAERDLWRRLADEVDAYLGRDEEAGLFA